MTRFLECRVTNDVQGVATLTPLPMQRGPPILIQHIHAGPIVDERLCNICVPHLAGTEQWRVFGLVCGVDSSTVV